ncbi:MAG: LytTR family transcriptional regulator DNA-binding domain-containing protein [Bacteroidota bacterium]
MLKKVVIVDDEEPARHLLREYLSYYDDLIIVGEANNGVDAVRLIQQLKPEIVFLDVQMPGLTGLQVLAKLDELPLVIFSTAYDQYALKAFELHAVDYLLKPYTKGRFDTAIEHLSERLQQPQEAVRSLTQSIVEQDAPNNYPSKILVAKGNKLVAVSVSDIQWIEADGVYCILHTQANKHLSRYGISQVEQKLSPETFIRVHRSYIINLNYVQEIFRKGHVYDVKMKNGGIVRVSRGYASKVKDMIV